MKEKNTYICNKCGTKLTIDNENQNGICLNCLNKIDISVSIKVGESEKTANRELYELENTIIEDKDYIEQLKRCLKLEINNDLTNYLMLKAQKKYDYNFYRDDSEYSMLIIKDILRSSSYSTQERIDIINSLNTKNKDLYLKIIDESIFRTDESKKMVNDLFDLKIEIVKNPIKKKYDFSFFKILLGIIISIFVFLFGLLFDKELSKPIVLILSIVPSVIIGVNLVRLFKIKSNARYLLYLISVVLVYLMLSYVEILRYDGFISLKAHLDSIIHAVPDFITELMSRLDFIDDRFNEPEVKK